MNNIKLNSEIFKSRCNKIINKLQRPALIFLGKTADVEDFNMSSAMFHYLLGYEFPETIIVIQDNPIIITSPKKAIILQQIEGLKIIIKNKDDSNFESILETLSNSSSSYGVVDKKSSKGDFCQKILSSLKTEDVSDLVLELFSIKENNELEYMNKCGLVANYLMVNSMDLIRDGSFNKDELENYMNDRIKGINSNYIEFAFDPSYSDMYPSDDGKAHDEFYIKLGIRYKRYCTEIGRPFLQDLTSYYEIQKQVLGFIRPNVQSKYVLDKVKEYLESKGYKDIVKLYTLGLMDREMSFESNFKLQNNMAFCLNINDKFCNTFFINDLPIFITKKDTADDYSSNRMRFRNKSNDASMSAKIKEHQSELLDKLIDSNIEYYKTHQADASIISENNPLKNISIYSKDHSVPRSDKIFLDWDNLYVIVPILSYSVPFHISTIKNVAAIVHNNEDRIRINFKDSKEIKDLINNGQSENAIYDTKIKFVTVVSRNAEEIIFKINEMKKEFNKPLISLKEQASLKEKYKKYALTDVYMRTDNKVANKKVLGNLELHENGFKYNDVVILFSNIKNIFYQMGDPDNKAILHFNLHEPIMHVKPTRNVQFFKEWNTSYLDVNRREDEHLELIQEQEEEEENMRINSEFLSYVERIEQDTNLNVQIPEKAFLGVHSKEAVFFYTTNDCIVSLNELPFFVLNFDEVEVMNFERVTFVKKTFDCVFVLKNKTKHPVFISSVETTKLNYIKELIDSHDIVFMETSVNINWNNLLATNMRDPLSFYESGGWSELLRDVEDEEDEENDDTESAVSDSESDESLDDEDDDSSACDVSEDVSSKSEDSDEYVDSEDDDLVSEDSEYDDESAYDSEDNGRNRKKRKNK